MIEAQFIGVQTEAPYRVIAITIFHIAANWMPHIGSMHADLILPPRLQTKLYQ